MLHECPFEFNCNEQMKDKKSAHDLQVCTWKMAQSVPYWMDFAKPWGILPFFGSI
jgi:hypothetical protein